MKPVLFFTFLFLAISSAYGEGLLASDNNLTQTNKHVLETSIQEILLAKPLALDEAELSGLTWCGDCLLYTSPSPRDKRQSRMPSSA